MLMLGLCGWTAVAGELRVEVLWTFPGRGGFSAPNAVYDARMGKATHLIVAERDQGVLAVSREGKRLWEFTLAAPVSAAPAVADLDGDGQEEIVAADSEGNLVALDAAGKARWRTRTPAGVRADSAPAVADLDGDRRPEIVVGDQAGTLSCFDHRGKLRWQFSGEGTQIGPVLIADLYDTAGRELIVPAHDRHVYALTARGEWLWDLYFPDDLFPNSTPVAADADGDGRVELYLGGGLHHFYVLDAAAAQVVRADNVHLHVNHALAAADLDGDGTAEVLFGNKGGAVWCYSGTGRHWTRTFRRSTFYAAPALVNCDADPDLEILWFSATGELHLLDSDGAPRATANLPCGVTATPLVGDANGDGVLDALITSGANGCLALVSLGVPYRPDARERGVFAGNRAHSGSAPAERAGARLPAPPGRAPTGVAQIEPVDEAALVGGPNRWRFDIRNPEQRPLALLSTLAERGGVVRHFVRHVRTLRARVALDFEILRVGTYEFRQRLVDTTAGSAERAPAAGQQRRRNERSQILRYAGAAADRDRLTRTVLEPTRSALRQWQGCRPEVQSGFRRRLAALEGMVAPGRQPAPPTALLAEARAEGLRLRELARAGARWAGARTFVAWRFDPWAFFDPRQTLPPAELALPEIQADLCRGEYESLALNLTAFTPEPLQVRVQCDDFQGPHPAPAAAHVALRRAVLVPTDWREQVADALPQLDEAGLLPLGGLETGQLWLTLNAKGLPPGTYTTRLRLTSLEPDPTTMVLPLRMTVHALELPRPLRFCLWTYEGGVLGTQNDAVLRDLVEHGVTVFLAPAPLAECDGRGQLTGPPDFAAHDAAVRRYAPHGLLLFPSPQAALRGPPFLSEAWKRGFQAYLRAWASHCQELGLDYDRWALYPYDEPSTPFTQTTLDLIEVARLVRAADPHLRIYANPTSGTTMETVEQLKGLVDLWCPSSELLERLGDEMLPAVRAVAKELWAYDAAGRAKTLSCLGTYRWRFWRAWNLGLTGVGWWTYAQHDDVSRWLGPNPTGDFFATVYEGRDGPVSSKRWEAAREGVEDYALLHLLRRRIERAAARGTDVTEARRLLTELPPQIEQVLFNTGRRLPLQPDSVPLYEEATLRLQAARARLIAACLRLGE